MSRYVALLRGVNPMNAKMAELKRCFERAGFSDVKSMRTAPKAKLKLPLEMDGARILAMKGGEVFTAYVPTGRSAAFMVLIEKTLAEKCTTA